MNSHVLHKIAFAPTAITSYLRPRKKRRRHCSTCRTFLHKAAIRCSYCGRRSLTAWHILAGATILALSIVLLSTLNSAGI